jgi:hypothetical protein
MFPCVEWGQPGWPGGPPHPDLLRAHEGGKAWEDYIAKQLSEDEVARLALLFDRSDTLQIARWEALRVAGLEALREDVDAEAVTHTWRMWVAQVLRIEVSVQDDGTTRLHDPLTPHSLEVQWRRDPTTGAVLPISLKRTADRGAFLLVPLTTPASWDDSWLVMWNDDPKLNYSLVLDAYLAALQLHLDRYGSEDFEHAPERRSKTGQPPDLDQYRRLLARHQVLVAEGHRDVTARLAAELTKAWGRDIDRATVRQYLRRGRRYLEREGDGSTAGAPRLEQTWRPPTKGDDDAKK